MAYPGKIRIIAGQFRGRLVRVLEAQTLRPTPDRIRETLFNWLQPKIVGARCLDCFAGTGILSFEALSRGAKAITMIESANAVVAALNNTITDLKIDPSQVKLHHQDVMQWFAKQKQATDAPVYDIVFLDPPFASDLLVSCLNFLEKNDHLLAADAWIYIEAPAHLSPVPVPAGWAPIKSKVSGQLGYHLLARI